MYEDYGLTGCDAVQFGKYVAAAVLFVTVCGNVGET
jgi:hypothetical protein